MPSLIKLFYLPFSFLWSKNESHYIFLDKNTMAAGIPYYVFFILLVKKNVATQLVIILKFLHLPREAALSEYFRNQKSCNRPSSRSLSWRWQSRTQIDNLAVINGFILYATMPNSLLSGFKNVIAIFICVPLLNTFSKNSSILMMKESDSFEFIPGEVWSITLGLWPQKDRCRCGERKWGHWQSV